VEVDLETPAEIIGKKVHCRRGTLQPRDMFDIACVARAYGDDYVIEALLTFKDKAAAALTVAENMNEGFAAISWGNSSSATATAISRTARRRPPFRFSDRSSTMNGQSPSHPPCRLHDNPGTRSL